QWQAWSAAQTADEREAAELCCSYTQVGGNLVEILLSLSGERSWYETGLAQAIRLGDRAAEWNFRNELTNIYTQLGEYERARANNQTALEYMRQIGDQDGSASNLMRMGDIVKAQDDLDQAIDFYRQALNIWRELHSQSSVAQMLCRLSAIES